MCHTETGPQLLSRNFTQNLRMSIALLLAQMTATDQHDRSACCGSSIVFFAKGFVRLEWALTQSITSRSEVNFPK
jgi:hypothetical protein